MTMVSLGDLARSLMLQRHTSGANTRLTQLTQEIASGRHTDQAAATRGDLGPLAAVEAALARLDGWQIAGATLSTRLDTMQTALGALDGIGGNLSTTLLAAGSATQSSQVDLAGREAADHLAAAVGVLNARAGDQSVFAGTRPDRPALSGAEELLDALLPVVAGATTAAGVEAAVQTWFDDPAGFSGQIYSGGAVQAGIAVGPGQTLTPGVTATDPALRSLLSGLATAALLDRGVLADAPLERRSLAARAGETLAANAADRTRLAAQVGITQNRLDEAQTRNTAERTALGIARSGLVSADPYATATALEATRTQLETLYTLTARLSGLSLIEALR